MALAVAPFAAQAETWNIYGWQNHSWEFVDIDGGQSFDRIQSNAGNIGFAASMDAGHGISVNVQCEQFMYVNHYAGGTGWCNRNSKIGLSHPQMGEIMFATWLLPYNEGVAQWVDPFYDAGADSHTSIMGSVGATTIFYNTGEFNGQGDWLNNVRFNYSAVNYDMGFNRRQENIIQYWSPNWNGFVFRFAWTAGTRDETEHMGGEIDPVIRSSSLAYTNGPLWAAVTWQDHEDWTAASVGEMQSSDAESFRVAGRYIMDMGDGMSVQISAMFEDLEYEFNGTTDAVTAMSAFGYSGFEASGNFNSSEVAKSKTRQAVVDAFGLIDDEGTLDASVVTDAITGYAITGDGAGGVEMPDEALTGAQIEALQTAVKAETGDPKPLTDGYNALVSSAKKAATAGSNVTVERDAWMVSGKLKFGGPIDFRFSYMDADDLEVSCAACSGDWSETAADAWNIGMFYTMPGGTELRLTYSEVNNDDNGTYGQGISGTGLGTAGAEVEMFAVGIVHWFD